MGRGRAKAKQAKVARQLKYSGAGTDLDALRKELVGGSSSSGEGSVELEGEFDDPEYDDAGVDDDSDDSDDADDADDEDGLGPPYRATGGR